MPIQCRARMIDGTPVTFEWEDHGRVPLDGLRDCYLTTMIGAALFIRSEFRPLGDAIRRFEFDRATLERHGIDTSTVERWESRGRGEGVWESMFEPRYRTSDSASGTISYAFNHDKTGQAMTDRKNLEEAIRKAHVGADRMSLGAACVSHDALKTILAAAEAHLATLPKTKMVEVWRGEWCQYENPKPFSMSEGHGADGKAWAEERAKWLRERSNSCSYACIRVTGPHQQEVPAWTRDEAIAAPTQPGLWKAHAWYSGTACDQETVLFYGSAGEARASAAKAIAGGARKAEVTGP